MNADGRVRRKVGRWKQEEVDELISLTRVYGRGKWKAILEHSGNVFQHRNQVPSCSGPDREPGSGPVLKPLLCLGHAVVSQACWLRPCRPHGRHPEQPCTAQGLEPCAPDPMPQRRPRSTSPANALALHSTARPSPAHSTQNGRA